MLTRIQFAKLVNELSNWGMRVLDSFEMEQLDKLVNPLEMVRTDEAKVDHILVDNLMKIMAEGQHKIDAIRAYRALTGFGLKEAKDAVEQYWIDRRTQSV